MSLELAIHSLMSSVHDKSATLEQEIANATNKTTTDAEGNTIKAELSQEDMLAFQFKIGQYNALMELSSSVTKSVTEMLKTLAQRNG
jgi:type III secretion protein F